jgi:alpha-amylase/alpha-mannosidase (GH57 family)
MRAEQPRLRVAICWHMHQPEYRQFGSGEYQLPWTYLHAIKDYVDMAAHLEDCPDARVVVNFAPILLEQIEDYAGQVNDFLIDGHPLRDPLLEALVDTAMPSDHLKQLGLITACLRVSRERLINRYPAYRHLAGIADWILANGDALRYLNGQFLIDLVVWYHLAWLGETVKRTDGRIRHLLEKETGYTPEDRLGLLGVIGELLNNVLPRYRALAERGQIELSVTPYAHPILPLLLDIGSAREAMPEANMPLLEHYPGGEERARWHIRKGLEVFQRHFGFAPAGCWPAEGGVGESCMRLLAEAGFRWAATGGNVLKNSLAVSERESAHGPHRPYRIQDSELTCFFRDDGLSDLIGFTYSDWHADDAVSDLIKHLETIQAVCEGNDRVVSIILDGENAWEYYPENGYYFLRGLYERLSAHPRIELVTFSDCLSRIPKPMSLPRLVAGSWVYGTFSTWIGDAEKNRGWDMLGDAKRCFDRTLGRLDDKHRQAAERQLAICEGSDWFWWFGDYNPADVVSDFERLFRMNLANLYLMLGEKPPTYLTEVFTHGAGSPFRGGAMRPGTFTS